MLNIETKTKLKPEDVIKRAVDFFGPKGLRLRVKQQSGDCAYFEGGGGGVDVTACHDGRETSVDFTSTEWDNQVKEFIGTLH